MNNLLETQRVKKDNAGVVRELYQIALRGEKEQTPVLPECLIPFANYFSNLREGFLKCDLMIQDMRVKADKVMVRYSVNGVPQCDFWGLPVKGKSVTIKSLEIFQLKDGEIVEHWNTVYQVNSEDSVK